MWRRTRRGLVGQACCRNTFGTFGKEQGKAPQKHAVHLAWAEIHCTELLYKHLLDQTVQCGYIWQRPRRGLQCWSRCESQPENVSWRQCAPFLPSRRPSSSPSSSSLPCGPFFLCLLHHRHYHLCPAEC